MNERVTIGQYIPGDSFIHRLDPRIKLVITILFIVLIFFIDSIVGFGIFFAFILGVMFVAQIPFMRLMKGLRPILFIILFTFFLNVFTTPGRSVFQFWIVNFTEEGLYKGAFTSVRLVLLVFGTTMLTLTTSPLELTDGIESLLKPLSVIKFPAHELAMMISIALSFIPTLFEEADKIRRAQMARGADFESGNVLNRAKAMIPLLVPLFLNSFRRAEELGTAMEARCYRGGKGRTRLNPLRLEVKDILALILTAAFFITVAYIW